MPLPQNLTDIWTNIMAILRFLARLPFVLLIIVVTTIGALLIGGAFFRFAEMLWRKFVANPW